MPARSGIYAAYHSRICGKRALQPLLVNNDPYAPLNQVLWSDIVYVKPLWNRQKLASPSSRLKSAIMFDLLLGSYDFAARALQDYDRSAGTSLTNAYVATLSERLAA